MRITEFGKELREIRLEKQEYLKDMADKLDVAPAYLSSVETGRRGVPKGWVEKISELYDIDIAKLKEAAINSTNVVKWNLMNSSNEDRELLVTLQRKFDELRKEEKEQILKIINE